MKTLFHHIRRFLLGLGIVALAGLSACSAGGGSSVTPSDSGGGVIAVEIPAVNDVNDLVYITGPLVAGAGADLSAKSLTKKLGMVGNPFTPIPDASNSVIACETNKLTRGLISDGSMADLILCTMKSMLEDFVTIATPVVAATIDDGTDKDVVIWVESDDGPRQVRARVNMARYDSGSMEGSIREFTMYFCGWNGTQHTQNLYLNETFGPSGAITIHSTGNDTSNSGQNTNYYYSKINVTGNLDADAKYTGKTIIQQHYEEDSDGNAIGRTYTQKATLTHVSDEEATINGFGREHNVLLDETYDTRIFSDFAFMYNEGVTTTVQDNSLWAIFAGAGRYLDVQFDNTECWNDRGKVDSSACGDYLTEVLKPANEPAAVDETINADSLGYAAGETYDCSTTPLYGIATGKPGSESNPLVLSTLTECAGFGELDSETMSCYDNTYGDFTVTPSYNGVTLSTLANAPTIVTSSTPIVQLTTNYPPSLKSFDNLQIETYNAPEGWHSMVGTIGEDYGNWNSDYSVLTLTYGTLYNNFEYSLTLDRQRGIGGKLADSATYYIKYIAP